MRLHLQTRNRCYNHPHRETELICERCMTRYCPECLIKREGVSLCANCVREVEDALAARLTPRQKLEQFALSLRVVLIIAAALAVIVAGLFFLYRGEFDRPLTPEELARFRYAMTGSFETEEGINVTSTVLGAKVVSATSADPTHPAKSLINEYTGPGAPAWRSTDATFPQEVVVSLDTPSTIEKVIFINQPSEPVESFPKDVEVLVSLEGPDRGFATAGRFLLAQTTDPQKFLFPVARASWVMLRVLSNQGSTAYTSLDEFNAYVIPNNPMLSSRVTPPAGTPASR